MRQDNTRQDETRQDETRQDDAILSIKQFSINKYSITHLKYNCFAIIYLKDKIDSFMTFGVSFPLNSILLLQISQ